MITKPRTFKHFPSDDVCPVCNTNSDAECILVSIDGTGTGKDDIVESMLVHLWCGVVSNYNRDAKVIYRRVK